MNPQNFASHIIFEKLGQLDNSLNHEALKKVIDINEYNFFVSVANFIKERLKVVIPVLIQDGELLNISNEVENATAQINAFIGNQNVGHLTNAHNHLNSALSQTKVFPVPVSKGGYDFSKSIAQFESTLQKAYTGLDIKNEELSATLLVLQQNVKTQQDQIATLQQQLLAKETELQNVLATYNTEFGTIKTNNSNAFESQSKMFSEAIDAQNKIFKEQFDTTVALMKSSFEEDRNKAETKAANVIDGLENSLEEARKIVNVVGNVGITGNYQRIANQHGRTANIFRIIALCFMALMSGLIVWSIIDLSSEDFNLYKSIVRVIAAAVLTYPAFYASRESNKHRILETSNRNLELELASIGPFIEFLPEDKKQKIKEDLVGKYFGNNLLIGESKVDEEVSLSSIERIAKVILPFMKK